MPPQDRVGLHDAHNLLKRPLAETLPDFGQCPPFAIGQAQTTLNLIPKNQILGHKILERQPRQQDPRTRGPVESALPVG